MLAMPSLLAVACVAGETTAPTGSVRVLIAPELERIVAAARAEAPVLVHSQTAVDWAEPQLSEALKRLGVDGNDTTVAVGIWSGPVVTLYRVPGPSSEALEGEFATVVALPPGTRWQRRRVDQFEINWAQGSEFSVSYWVGCERLSRPHGSTSSRRVGGNVWPTPTANRPHDDRAIGRWRHRQLSRLQ